MEAEAPGGVRPFHSPRLPRLPGEISHVPGEALLEVRLGTLCSQERSLNVKTWLSLSPQSLLDRTESLGRWQSQWHLNS